MKLTRNGISYNLKESPYFTIVKYNNQFIQYRFSSENNLNKFIERMADNRDKVNASLSNRFKFDITLDIICDLKLYDSVETRGFFVAAEREVFECLSEVKLDGEKLTCNYSQKQ